MDAYAGVWPLRPHLPVLSIEDVGLGFEVASLIQAQIDAPFPANRLHRNVSPIRARRMQTLEMPLNDLLPPEIPTP
jgi:hypothetical protein